MAKLCMNLGIVLVVLGLGAYFGLGRQSATALIPAFFGVPFYLLGMWARDESKRKLAMHLAATLALLGFGGSVSGISATLRLLGGAELERPEAAVVKAVMALLCLIFLVLAVRSFIAARKAMTAN